MSELSQRLSQVRNILDDLVEADKLVDSIGELLAQRNVLREQIHDMGTEIASKRQTVEQEVAALDADLATRQHAFAEEIARMEQQTATAKAELARAEHELQDVHMRLNHTQAVYDEIRKKFA
jgi:chromosome segregation ATPase